MHFPHIFLFKSVTSRSSIDSNALISIFNNQPCMNYKNNNIICNNVACFTAYLANAIIILNLKFIFNNYS